MSNNMNSTNPPHKEQAEPDWLKWSCGQCPDWYINDQGRGRCKRKAPNLLLTKWHGCEARKKEVLAAKQEVDAKKKDWFTGEINYNSRIHKWFVVSPDGVRYEHTRRKSAEAYVTRIQDERSQDPSKASSELRKHWRLMDQLERAENNVAIWTAKLETCKKYLKNWEAKTKRLKALLDTAKEEEIKQRSAVINSDWMGEQK